MCGRGSRSSEALLGQEPSGPRTQWASHSLSLLQLQGPAGEGARAGLGAGPERRVWPRLVSGFSPAWRVGDHRTRRRPRWVSEGRDSVWEPNPEVGAVWGLTCAPSVLWAAVGQHFQPC